MNTGSATKTRRRAKSKAGFFKLSEAEAVLWKRYLKRRSDANRNTIAEYYLPFLESKILPRLHKRYPFLHGDLNQDAAYGMLEAIPKFEPARNVQFLVFAYRRIAGNVVDGIRKLDPVPRLVRNRMQLIKTAQETLIKKHGQEPTDRQIARLLKITLQKLADWKHEIATTNIVERNDTSLKAWDLSDHFEYDLHPLTASIDETESAPTAHSHLTEWWETLLRGSLPLEKVVIVLYFYYQWQMWKISLHCGLAESRISQVAKEFYTRIKGIRNFNDFSDIPDNRVQMKCLRDILPICHRLRRKYKHIRSLRTELCVAKSKSSTKRLAL
jgi:RNA polymerase sigma factor FliA